MNVTFAEHLRCVMNHAGMNQVTLSERTGASRAAISQYLSGKNTPSYERIKILAKAVGVPVEYLTGQITDLGFPTHRIVKVTVRGAARCLGKSVDFVRIGLQQGILPFGVAVPGRGGKWNYDIRPDKFREYVGDEVFNSFFGVLVESKEGGDSRV